MGIIGMKYWKCSPFRILSLKKTLIFSLIGSPVLLIIMLLIQPFGGGFFYYTYTLTLCSYGFLIIFVIQYMFGELFDRWNRHLIQLNFLLLLITPLAWQIMMVFLFSIAKFDGYTFWIPMSELIMNSFIVPVT